MFLVDTNVVSELRKAKSHHFNKNVKIWAKNTSPSSLYVSVISILELEIGILRVERKDGRQGAILRSWLDSHVMSVFADRIIYLDVPIAQKCARLHIPNPRSDRDAIIAATALVHGMTLVTRNIVDFKNTGVALINPWESCA